MTTKTAKATFEGHGLRITITLDSVDATARLTAIEACRRIAHRFMRWSTDGEVLASAPERAAFLAENDSYLRPALKCGVVTIQVTK